MKKLLLALTLLFCGHAFAACSPFGATGVVQVFNNNGVPIPNGVIYSYQAGTSTQQATFTDSTCGVANNNPITMTSGGRANIWLISSNFYKFVLCIQNDGASCAPADVLFSVDNVPGSAIGASSPFIGTFISGSANPASTGILELASSDSICWRNQANTINLCISKDTSDVLGWNGGDMKFTETTCAATAAGFDYLCADNTAHRWTMFNNGGTKTQIVGAGVDINNSDQVTQLHFGSTAVPLASSIANGNCLAYNGTNLSGQCPALVVLNAGVTGTTTSTLTKLTGAPSTAVIASTTDTGGIVGITTSGAGTGGNATIQQMGLVSCVFDGATTAGDYISISSTTGGDCHDGGSSFPTSGQVIGRVLSTNGGAGTYSIVLFAPEQKPSGILLHTNTTTIVNGTIPNSNTTVFSKAITMPSGCPCRIVAYYALYFTTTNSGVQAAMVSDGTNNWAPSVSNETGSVGTIGVGQNGAGSSPTTYSSGANVTVTVVAASTAAGSATANSGVGASLTGAPASQLVIDVIGSN